MAIEAPCLKSVRPPLSRAGDGSADRLCRPAMKRAQRDLFGSGPALPPGFAYRADLISAEEERALVARLADLPFKEFEFQGYRGKRRVVSFGWQYDFTHARLHRVED